MWKRDVDKRDAQLERRAEAAAQFKEEIAGAAAQFKNMRAKSQVTVSILSAGLTITPDEVIHIPNFKRVKYGPPRRIEAEMLGADGSRVTLTRMATIGVFAFAAKKRDDKRQVHIRIWGDDYNFRAVAKGDDYEKVLKAIDLIEEHNPPPSAPPVSAEPSSGQWVASYRCCSMTVRSGTMNHPRHCPVHSLDRGATHETELAAVSCE